MVSMLFCRNNGRSCVKTALRCFEPFGSRKILYVVLHSYKPNPKKQIPKCLKGFLSIPFQFLLRCLICLIHCCLWISLIIKLYNLAPYLLWSHLYPTHDLFCLREPTVDKSPTFLDNVVSLELAYDLLLMCVRNSLNFYLLWHDRVSPYSWGCRRLSRLQLLWITSYRSHYVSANFHLFFHLRSACSNILIS